MNYQTKFRRVVAAAVFGLCAQPLLVSAQAQQAKTFAVDSVSKHVKSNPKPKKTTGIPTAAIKSPTAKAKRESPSTIILPGAQPAAQKQATVPATARKVAGSDSVPPVQRSPRVAKKPPR